MKYADWKTETSLNRVCAQLLDNADMDYEFINDPLSLKFIFYVIGSDIKVIFECKSITEFSLKQESDDSPLYVVLDVSVKIDVASKIHEIQIAPDPEIIVKCKDFSWYLAEFDKSERFMIYGL